MIQFYFLSVFQLPLVCKQSPPRKQYVAQMASDPTFSPFLRLYYGSILLVNKLFQSSADGARAMPKRVLAEKYSFPIGSHT